MKMITCVITHNRLDYTKKTIESYLDTTKVEDRYLIVVDNASSDGTQDYLSSTKGIDQILFNSENKFPGAAVNSGWDFALQRRVADFLHRSDNDVEYTPGWMDYVCNIFEKMPEIGQLGLLTFEENGGNGMELNIDLQDRLGFYLNTHYGGNIGGVCVIPLKVWNHGVRYQETIWRPGANEDFYFSQDIRNYGYKLYAVAESIVLNISKDQGAKYPEYTEYTTKIRNIGWHW
jgi:glycosyltransferase involved in cell wall biosynthesis